MQMLWPLATVLTLIVFGAYALRRWAARGGIKLGADGPIRILARHYLSNKQSLCLVRIGQRLVLIGVTPEHISAVAEVSDPDEAALLTGQAQRGSTGSFTQALSRFATGYSQAEDDASEPPCATPSAARLQSAGEGLRSLTDRVRHWTANSPARGQPGKRTVAAAGD